MTSPTRFMARRIPSQTAPCEVIWPTSSALCRRKRGEKVGRHRLRRGREFRSPDLVSETSRRGDAVVPFPVPTLPDWRPRVPLGGCAGLLRLAVESWVDG